MMRPQDDSALIQAAYEHFVPLFATIELTLRCNLRCRHCYNFDRDRPLTPEQVAGELSWHELTAVLDDLARLGGLEVSFSGGEALLHPLLTDLVKYARKHLFAVRIKSNGMLYDANRAQALSDAGVYATDISLYGATRETHDRMTGLAGSFDRTVAGLRFARDAGLRVSLSYCLTRHNAQEINAMVALAEAEGVSFTIDPHMTARYDGTRSSLDHRVSIATLETLYRGALAPLIAGGCDRDRDLQCSCARAVVAIGANGDVYPCIGAPIRAGNIREQSLGVIWEQSSTFQRIRSLGLQDYPVCRECPDRPWCRRSNGVILTNTGDYTGVEDFTCQEAALLHRLDDEKGAAKP